MKVILGLGNPGKQYESTRHNVGWWVLDHLADVWHFDPGWKKDGEALVRSGVVGGEKVRLVKPQTYMNLSGQVLRTYLKRPFWSVANDLLVISDDVAIPNASYRVRARGSAGGHNGLKSIEHHLKTQEYARLRVGIKPADERRDVGDLADFVLAPFGKIDRDEVLAQLPTYARVVETWMKEGVEAAMNKHNGG